MPDVPRLQPRVAEQGLPQVRSNVNAPVEAFGGGVEGLTKAARGVGQTMVDIYDREAQKVDDLRTMEANNQMTDLVNRYLYDNQKGAMNRQGKDAFGIIDEFGKQFDDDADAIEEGLGNERQKSIFRQVRARHRSQLNQALERHTFQQSQKYEADTATATIKTAQNDAVLNYHIPGRVEGSLGLQAAAITRIGQSQGKPQELIDLEIKSAHSQTHKGVIARMLENDQVKEAKTMFAGIRENMAAEDAIALEKAIADGEVSVAGSEIYGKIRGMKLADGMPDLARQRAYVFSQKEYTAEQKGKIWNLVEARASEDVVNKNRADHARDSQFLNSVYQARKDGMPLEQAYKLADKFKIDNTTEAEYRNVIKKVYAPKEASNPIAAQDLWERIQEGGSSKAEIDDLFNRGEINVQDWENSRKDYYRIQNEGKNPEDRLEWKRITTLADKTYSSNTQKKKEFLYVVQAKSRGKSPEERYKIAEDLLKDDDGSGWFMDDPKWKAELKKLDDTNLAWGKFHEDIGREEASAIAVGSGKENWGLGDIDEFAAHFGGYNKIKKGTPVNNAIQYLSARGQRVTKQNIDAVLKAYPNGKP